MKNNKLISYKENFFTKILSYFKKLFFKKKEATIETIDETPIYNIQYKDSFIENIMIRENEEEKRLKSLQLQYDNGEIDEADISDADMDKLIALYEKETEELNADTEKRIIHIAYMLKELKNV